MDATLSPRATTRNSRRRNRRRGRRGAGFTLVELLVVVAIIGILASLITGAAIVVRRMARVTVIATEISQLDMACKAFKERFGEYPPDGTDMNAARRFFTRAFPRCPISVFDTWVSQKQGLGASTALTFWLGGVIDPTTKIAYGFSLDPTNPFAAPASANEGRIGPFFDFDPDRVIVRTITINYQRIGANIPPTVSPINPYFHTLLWYFRAPYTATTVQQLPDIKLLPYVRTSNGVSVAYVNPQSFQIICGGLDNKLGPTGGSSNFGFPDGKGGTASGTAPAAAPYHDTVWDNITNFSGRGTLEDSVP